jgi:site-specific recombinase XerC
VKVEHLRTIMAEMNPRRPIEVRDRALLLIGFASAFRRAELVGLDIDDLEFNHGGLVVHLQRSKTDQTGKGRDLGIPSGSTPATCPVRAMKDWLELLKTDNGPVFRVIDR